MGAKIFSLPSTLKVPEYDFKNPAQYQKDETKFFEDLKALLLKRKNEEGVGEIIKFQVADSYAVYAVASMKPLELIHIPIMDAWEFEYAHRLTAKDVKEKIKIQKALDKLFTKKEEK